MRIDVHKYLIMGPMSIKELFFKRVQKLGIAEFLGIKLQTEQPADVQLFLDALHILRQRVAVPQVPSAPVESAHVLARHIVEIKDQLEQLREKERMLEKERARIAIFGDFSLVRLHEIEKESGRVIQFFVAKAEMHLDAKDKDEVLFVGSEYGMDYFVTINREATSYDGFVEIRIDRSVSELEADLAQTTKLIDSYDVELATLAHHKNILQEGLALALNEYHLSEASKASETNLDDTIFAVACWVPDNKIAQLEALTDELGLYLDETKVEEEDRLPTYLENKGTGHLGQDLVSIYDIPSARDRDPSNWVFFSFALFFSMIVGDAGYGLILLAISLFLYYKFAAIGGLVRRTILLSTSLAIGCIFWGAMTSSFLGTNVAIDSPVRSISFVHWMVKKKADYLITHKPALYKEFVKEFPSLEGVTDAHAFLQGGVKKVGGKEKYVIYEDFTDNIMMELAIFIGTLHIILSFLRYIDRNWAGYGWILFMIGGYLYFPLVLKAISLIHFVFGVPYELGGQIGFYLIFVGMGVATLFAIIQNKLAGTAELMQVISVFADVMSYLRIYALALAGMIMASTFNDIGGKMPWYLGLIIIFAGHTVNFTLALMGGLIHGLRLNFIEWYHYSFEGGGKSFNPLSLIKH